MIRLQLDCSGCTSCLHTPALHCQMFCTSKRLRHDKVICAQDLHAPSRLHIQASSLKDKQHLLPPVEQQNAVALLRIHDAAPRGRDPTFGKPTRVASVNAAASALIYLSVEVSSPGNVPRLSAVLAEIPCPLPPAYAFLHCPLPFMNVLSCLPRPCCRRVCTVCRKAVGCP